MTFSIEIPGIMFDADSLIAGSFSRKGASFILLQLCELGLLKGFITQQVKEECERNLGGELASGLQTFEKFLSRALTVIDNPIDPEVDKYRNMAHEKDVSILVAAIKTNTKFLVTFNIKDFYPSADIGIEIIAPGELLKKIRLMLAPLGGE